MAKIKITLAERDGAWLYDTDADVAVPFELTFSDGTAHIEYYPAAKALTDEFIHRFGDSEDSIFLPDAADFLYNRFDGFLSGHGFSISPDSHGHYVCFKLPKCDSVSSVTVRRLTGDEDYDDLTDSDIGGLCGAGYIMYAAVIENEIAAVANTGEPVNDESPCEIEVGVDTTEKYRRRGLGKACLTALINELYSLGHVPTYECASDNTASLAMARSLCGRETYKKFYIVGFRDE